MLITISIQTPLYINQAFVRPLLYAPSHWSHWFVQIKIKAGKMSRAESTSLSSSVLISQEVYMKIECLRCFGQLKLNKPKECNNINLLGSVAFNRGFRKGVKCKVWKSGETVYVLQRDWFSSCISFEEAISHGIIKPEQPRKKFIKRKPRPTGFTR